MNKLDTQTSSRILHFLRDGPSIRSITRVMPMSKNTIAKLLSDADGCARAFRCRAFLNRAKLPPSGDLWTKQ